MASNIHQSSGSFKFSHYTKSSLFLDKISEEVQTFVRKLDEKKEIHHGDIPTKFLKLSGSVGTSCLTHIFNRCMTEGTYPSYLKEAQIAPLQRSRDSAIYCAVNIDRSPWYQNLTKFSKECCMTDYVVIWKNLVCCQNCSTVLDQVLPQLWR